MVINWNFTTNISLFPLLSQSSRQLTPLECRLFGIVLPGPCVAVNYRGSKMEVLRILAFSDGERDGNPAGVLVFDALPREERMQVIVATLQSPRTKTHPPRLI